MITIRKGSVARKREQEDARKTSATAEHVKAVTDYNIMMGILEDPSEEEEDE